MHAGIWKYQIHVWFIDTPTFLEDSSDIDEEADEDSETTIVFGFQITAEVNEDKSWK